MDLEKYKSEIVQKLVQDETFQSKVKQVCDFILSLSMKNKGVITFEDLILFEVLGECSAKAIKGTADILHKELLNNFLEGMKSNG